jgi:predicted Abi (CAAX) family protease
MINCRIAVIGALLLPIPALLFGYESLESTAGSSSPLSFPLRLLLLVAIAAVLGWGLGYFIAQITKRNAHGTVVIAAIVSIIWALLLLVVADGLATPRPQLPEFLLFVLVGMALVLWLLVFQLRAERNYGNATMVADRSLLIAIFAGTTFGGALVIHLSVI